jgi:hypothetical protein
MQQSIQTVKPEQNTKRLLEYDILRGMCWSVMHRAICSASHTQGNALFKEAIKVTGHDLVQRSTQLERGNIYSAEIITIAI